MNNKKMLSMLMVIIWVAQFLVEALTFGVILQLDLLPGLYVTILGVLFALVWILPGVLLFRKKKKGKTGCQIVALILVTLIILGCAGVSGMVSKFGQTMNNVTGKTEITTMMTVYVRSDDDAQDIQDAADYTFATLKNVGTEKTRQAVDTLQNTLGKTLTTVEYAVTTEMADALYAGEVDAILLSSAYAGTLADTEGYTDFASRTKVLHEVTIVEESKTDDTQLKEPLTTRPVIGENKVDKPATNQKGEEATVANTPFLVYLSGNDTRSTTLVTSRSDVNIIAAVNPVTKQILLVNTPRDYFIPHPNSPNGERDKLTHLGNDGINCSVRGLEALYNERIDAETFAEWGIEYFKYDYCHHVLIPTAAPYIDSVSVGGEGIDGELVFKAKDAVLSGEARVIEEKNGESYVKGLCSGLGTIEFNNVEVQKDGEYVLTLVMRKNTCDGQFCVVTVNGTDKYDFLIAEQKAFSREGRRQIKIKLNAGVNTISITNPVGSPMDSAAMQYEKMGKELKRATKKFAEENNCEEKKILYSICEWGWNKPWKWGGKAGNIWRTTGDIMANWASIVGIYEVNVRLNEYAQPGAFNDPDMLEVGNGKLTYDENKAHFTLWSMMAAPLILGNDIRSFIKEDGTVDKDNKILGILTNKEVIAVNQDKLGIQCKRIKSNGFNDVLVKPLENNEVAVCFFNKGPVTANMSVSFDEIHNVVAVSLPKAESYTIRELWDNTEETVSDRITASVASHAVKVYRVSANV